VIGYDPSAMAMAVLCAISGAICGKDGGRSNMKPA
jgi:hypothetical protein